MVCGKFCSILIFEVFMLTQLQVKSPGEVVKLICSRYYKVYKIGIYLNNYGLENIFSQNGCIESYNAAKIREN